MTSVMRYRAEEDGGSGDVVPPKPHRLKPLDDEDRDRSSSGEGTAKTEAANATSSVPRPPDRPTSAESGASPKTRMVKASASTQQVSANADTVESMSGASTADTVTSAAAPSEGLDREKVAKKTSQRVSINACLPPDAEPELPKSRSLEPYNNSLSEPVDSLKRTPGLRSHSVAGTVWTKSVGSGSAKLQHRISMVGDPALTVCATPREICNFYYRQAEQRWLWYQMQHRTSGLQEGDILSVKANLAPEPDAEVRANVCSKMDVFELLDDDGNVRNDNTLNKLSPQRSESLTEAEKEAQVRRQSVYILQAEDELKEAAPCVKKKRIKKGKTKEALDAEAAERARKENEKILLAKGPNPLKDSITAKKVDLDQIREVYRNAPDAKSWIDTILDPGPPLVPKPIVYAVGMNDPGLVDLMIELGANVPAAYDGPSMYKGWLKPGASLIQSVQNRKGRFVGTMLADRLTQIEVALGSAIAKQHAKAGQEEDEEEEEKPAVQEVQLVEEHVEEKPNYLDGETTRRKSVAVKIGGNLMRHTQGHPGEVFEISEHLGDGDRSSVWLGFHKETKSPVAIKTEQKSTAIEAWLWEEINLMRKVEHPNIAMLFETFESEKQIFMVLELCEGGRWLKNMENIPESCTTIVKSPKLLRQTTMAVDFLHNKCIAHRDIQLDNFLLADDKPLSEATVKLIDFTTAKMFGPDQPPLKTKICTPGYVAKEILTRKEIPYTEKVDIWSLGVMFFILLSGTPPFYGATDMETLKMVKKGVFEFEPQERWAPVPNEAKQLITSMINPSVEDRLSSSAVLAHTFIANA